MPCASCTSPHLPVLPPPAFIPPVAFCTLLAAAVCAAERVAQHLRHSTWGSGMADTVLACRQRWHSMKGLNLTEGSHEAGMRAEAR
eukprot:1146986-Pelagomonas_calceolata.AAC.4